MSPRQRRFDRLVGMLALAGLVVGILWVLRPFVSAVVWAIVLTYSTWPVFEFVRRSMRCKSTLAASVMTALLTLVILLPVTVLVLSLGDSVAPVAEAIRELVGARSAGSTAMGRRAAVGRVEPAEVLGRPGA